MIKKKLNLSDVTLVSVTSVRIPETVKALLYSSKQIDFGQILLLSHKKPYLLPKKIKFKKIKRLQNIDMFNYFMLFELHKYITTPYILQIHYDGYVVHPELWKNEFCEYDYIGSPWPDWDIFKDSEGIISRVGNSVGIRSKKLLELPSKINMPFDAGEDGLFSEDKYICCRYKHVFEKNGCRFAPLEVARYFGKELSIPENKGIETFLFHKFDGENRKYKDFESPIKKIIRKRLPMLYNLIRKLIIH